MNVRSEKSYAGPVILALLVALLCGLPGAADAQPTTKKAIWGPAERAGSSLFPTYERLGVGLYQTQVRWDAVAPTRPADAANPGDPAYRWPADLDQTIADAGGHGIQVVVQLIFAPRWANGGRSPAWAPSRPQDFAAFAAAAARRYPAVHHWMIWGEPTRTGRFRPMAKEDTAGAGLHGSQLDGPHLYARILDAAYGALKAVSRSNLVIGGNTFTTGRVAPRSFIRSLRLPGGKPPRMDLYGHNPFSNRRPDLTNAPLGHGWADFSDVDRLYSWVNGNLRRSRSPIRLFLSEFLVPTDHANRDFNFHTTRKLAASWIASGLRLTRRDRHIYTLGVFLYDDPPLPAHDEVRGGLLTYAGQLKPAFDAFRKG